MNDLRVESRACGECRNFNELGPGCPICTKLLIGVHPGMQVPYRKSIGSCFEAIEQTVDLRMDVTADVTRRKVAVPA